MRLAKKFTFFSDLNAFKSIKITKKALNFRQKIFHQILNIKNLQCPEKKLRVRVFVK